MLKSPRFIFEAAVFLIIPLLISTPLTTSGAEALTPGAVEQTLRPPAPPQKEAPPPPELSAPVTSSPPSQTQEQRVKVEHFVITGNTVFSEAELNLILADLTGAELTLTEIYAAADRLTDYYQKQGYSLCTVTVPAQRLRDGILRLEVIEGVVGKLLFTGQQRYSEVMLKQHFAPIQAKSILRLDELERQLLLLNDMPGLLVRSAIVPGEGYGTSDLQLQVKETPVAASVALDNQGREVIGAWRLGADFTINNPAKIGDALSIGYTHTEDNLLRQGRFSYGLPISHDGLRLNLSYFRAEYDLGGEFTALGIAGKSESARLQLSQPIIRTRNRNLAWTLAFVHILGQSDMQTAPLSDDEINFPEIGLNYNRRSGRGMTTLSALASANFRDTSTGNSAALPPNLRISGSHEQFLDNSWSAEVHGETLYGTDTLPDSNKYSLGGPASVRGFVSSILRGDQGGFGSLELRRYLQYKAINLQLRGFIDSGWVHYHQALADGSKSNTLTSAGLGASALIAQNYSANLTWATPLDGQESGDGHSKSLWMTFTASY